jgi:GT2 family glycosyltransferase
MKFSIIIPTCDRPENLRECLRRVIGQRGANAEVIVSDDSRAEGARMAVAEFPGAQWMQGPRRGPAANRNSGARQAKGEWLLFVDDDCQPEEGWLAAYERAASDEADVLEGRTDYPARDEFAFYQVVENLNGGAFWSCNLAVRREKFAELGGFDEDFTEACAEDMEFAWRMRDRGLRCVFVEKARVTHPPRPMNLVNLLKRTAAHRWILLYRLKTGQAPGLDSSADRVIAHLLAREYLDNLRMLVQLARERRRIKGTTMQVLWRWCCLGTFMPYYIYWELKWRRLLRGGGGSKATSPARPDR